MEEIKLAIIEDNDEIRQWLTELFVNSPGFRLLGSYATGEIFLDAFNDLNPDIVLVDIHLPGASGIECVKKSKPLNPSIQFMMCTIYEEAEMVFDSLCAGATGYILKTSPPEQIIEAIKELHNGGSPMTSQIARKVVDSFRQKTKESDLINKLSVRENEILQKLAKGYRYKEISAELFISIETVRTHIRNIYEKLEVQSRTEAINKIYPR